MIIRQILEAYRDFELEATEDGNCEFTATPMSEVEADNYDEGDYYWYCYHDKGKTFKKLLTQDELDAIDFETEC